MSFTRHLIAAAKMLLIATLALGLGYPLAITVAARTMPGRADGSLVRVAGRVVGSTLLGQATTDPRWFQARPSASRDAGATSGGSNLAADSAAQQQAVAERVAALREANPDAPATIPPDALSASASGLDPDISVAYARWQVPRVAAARGLPESTVSALVAAHTSHALLGFIGQDRVDVLELNRALAAVSG